MKIQSNDKKWQFEDLLTDAGVDGAYLGGTLRYQSYDGFCATAMPSPVPTGKQGGACVGTALTQNGVSLVLEKKGDCFQPSIKGLSGTHTVSGVMILFSGIPVGENAWFEFPANLPWQRFEPAGMKPYEPVCSWFSGSALHLYDGTQHIDLLYRNTVEKWVSGGWVDDRGLLNLFFLAAAEYRTAVGETQTFGTVKIAVTDRPYDEIRNFFETSEPIRLRQPHLYGPMYCCHPFGTTDTGYAARQTFSEYAKELPKLADMGIQTVYVLPVYAHKGHDDIYSPTDLGKIDARYGGEAGAAEFVRIAHTLGMKVIFDFVPHGPEPDSELAQLHLDWCAKKPDGELQSEWNCVCFDPVNSAYAAYLRGIVKSHAERLRLDGMRLDCAMGGCANWSPASIGIRASASSLQGGVTMTQAVRDGFTDAGREALLMPEMTYPLPDYQGATECFYNNTLYRVLMDLNAVCADDRILFTQSLLRWLSVQHQCKPRGQVLGNWLENHDTVLWAGDAKRAYTLYGEGLCENMFRLISWIDGFPVIYQGDEAPGDYGLSGKNLVGFFQETFALREAYFPYDAETVYLPSDTAVFDFRKITQQGTYRVLLNLSKNAGFVNVTGNALYLHQATLQSTGVLLDGYGAAILKEKKGEME